MFPQDLNYLPDVNIISIATAITVLLALILLFSWVRRRFQANSEDRKIEKTIKTNSEAYIRNVVLSDGLYGYHFVDYLILLRGKILALDVQHLHGYIFGAENIDEWAQVVNSRSNKFQNPLYRINQLVQRINTLVKGADIEGRVIFTSESSFPKGIPNGVLRMDNFKDVLSELSRNDYLHESMAKIWTELVDITKKHRMSYNQETK